MTKTPKQTETATSLDDTALEQTQGGANDYLLTLDGIPGESKDDVKKPAKLPAPPTRIGR